MHSTSVGPWFSRGFFSALVAAVILFAGLAVSAEPAILPINRAKFLVGQRFDFLVEFEGEARDITVTLNGRHADDFFGTTGSVKTVDGIASYRNDGVAFTEAGTVEVEVSALLDGGAQEAAVRYEVVADSAPRLAKNVILYIGDGMGLPVRDMARILRPGQIQRYPGDGKTGPHRHRHHLGLRLPGDRLGQFRLRLRHRS